ncbi:MAG TPA: hypothetical protein VF070_32005 [Streptosporangiaceae bacterium]
MVGGADPETSAWQEFLTLVLRLTPGLLTRGMAGHKFVVHHLLAPRPVKQRVQETVLNRVLPGQFPCGPAGFLAG